jgi:hypothetical protein
MEIDKKLMWLTNYKESHNQWLLMRDFWFPDNLFICIYLCHGVPHRLKLITLINVNMVSCGIKGN